jgi:hypothetical protein
MGGVFSDVPANWQRFTAGMGMFMPDICMLLVYSQM